MIAVGVMPIRAIPASTQIQPSVFTNCPKFIRFILHSSDRVASVPIITCGNSSGAEQRFPTSAGKTVCGFGKMLDPNGKMIRPHIQEAGEAAIMKTEAPITADHPNRPYTKFT
jgi:hypothetical protein